MPPLPRERSEHALSMFGSNKWLPWASSARQALDGAGAHACMSTMKDSIPLLRSSRLHISRQPASVAAFAWRRADAGTKPMPCCMAGTALPVSGTFQQKPVKRRKISAITCKG